MYRDAKGRPVAEATHQRQEVQHYWRCKGYDLFGSHLWSGQKLVICEGEMGAMSVSQVQGTSGQQFHLGMAHHLLSKRSGQLGLPYGL